MINLGNPLALFSLIFPLLTLISFLYSYFYKNSGAIVSDVSNYRQSYSLKIAGHFLSVILLIIALFLISFSLAKPRWGVKREKIVSNGVDMIVSLDVSPSMLTQDYPNINRIDASKSILSAFIKMRKSDRIGLVTFAEDSLLKCPATTHHDLLQRIVANIYISPHKAGKTAIGVGLASAINRLINLEDNTKAESKVVILVTDGENNAGEITPDAAIKIAQEKNIKVYTVGIGSEEEIDIGLLKRISSDTGGEFFHAKNSNYIDQAFQRIDELEKVEIESYQFTMYKNLGFIFAQMGICLFIIALFFQNFVFKRLY